MSILWAATYPERTTALITLGTFAKRIWSEDYPWAPTPEERELDYANVERNWGRDVDLEFYAPSMAGDRAYKAWLLRYFRRSASPQAAVALLKMNTQVDIRGVLHAVQVPTLVMNRVGDRDVKVEKGRYLAARIPGAKLVELPEPITHCRSAIIGGWAPPSGIVYGRLDRVGGGDEEPGTR